MASTRILVCTDGSSYARSVYDHAAWAAERLNLGLQVLHVMDSVEEVVPHVHLGGSSGLNPRWALKDDLAALEEAEDRSEPTHGASILTAAREYFAQKGFRDVQAEASYGVLDETIGAWGAHAALVVLGKRGESADSADPGLGANLEGIIRACKHPVLVASRAFRPMERMLIAFDGGDSAKRAVEFAVTQRLLQDMKCILFAVGRPTTTIEKDLQAAANTLRAVGYEVDARYEQGDPERLMTDVLKKERINLLIMGAYGHSRIREFIVGSTTTALLQTSGASVLVFH